MDFTLVSSAFETLRIAPPSKLTLLEARTLSPLHYPPFPPDIPALLMEIDSLELASQVEKILLAAYPREHEFYWVVGSALKVESLGNFQPPVVLRTGLLNFDPQFPCIYLPPLGEGTSFESFAEIVAHLRAPEDGCPWDKEQTHESLRKHLLEESYEAISAIDSGDFTDMREEFGDLLLQVVLQSQIAMEEGQFNINQVVQGISSKLVRRHPHVFGSLELNDVNGVLANWEKLKETERKDKGQREKGLLDGIPAALPALSQAQEYQDRAARVGFDWPEVENVLDKVREEIEEVKQAQNLEEVTAELGDLFFVLVNLARWRKVDAESALREANVKFKKRFGYVEQGAKKQGRNLSDMTLEEMDVLWNEAKRLGM